MAKPAARTTPEGRDTRARILANTARLYTTATHKSNDGRPAEIGDKIQLLVLVLAVRFRKPLPIVLKIVCATLANHGAATRLGVQALAEAGEFL